MGRLGIYVFVLLCLISNGRTVHAEGNNMVNERSPQIEQFSEIEPGLYRGAQPDKEAINELKEMGFKTVVNFRYEKHRIAEERAWVEDAGMTYVSLPWNIMSGINVELFESFYALIADPARRPLFFHCKRGVERTGVAAAFYRMKYEGKSREEASRLEFDPYPLRFIWKPFVKKRLQELEDRMLS